MNIVCWWFGCDPIWEAYGHGDGSIPCARCGAHNTTYEDRAGITRHEAAKSFFRYWFFRRWWPKRCICGKRWQHEMTEDCIPF